jgi:hypothetical protein
MTDFPITLTEHAQQRARQRFRLNPTQTARRALERYVNGRHLEHMPRPIREHFTKEARRYPHSTLRFHGCEVWCFAKEGRKVVLVTVWHISPRLYSAGQEAILAAALKTA